MAKTVKTNAMRILETEKIAYTMHTYPSDGPVDGVHVAAKMGLNVQEVYKTLVTKGKSGSYFVFVIPVAAELNLKAAAGSVGEKSVALIPVKSLLPVTGYLRGGCSPIGMKKAFVTVIDQTAEALPRIFVSGGKIGVQIELSPTDLAKAAKATFQPIIY